MAPAARRLALGSAIAAGLAAVFAAVFALYSRPDIAVMLAEQLWACFGG
jgi:uncharacterized membrane protein YgaE (UPF0421/DUF939 family)